MLLRRMLDQSPVVKRVRDEAGQTTAEYALVIVGAAAIAVLLITWAKDSGAITDLFDSVIDRIMP
jgi:Flp pilus assembly pilin Flp